MIQLEPRKRTSICEKRKNLLQYAKGFESNKRLQTVIINAKSNKMINDGFNIYTELDWLSFFNKELEYTKLNEDYYYYTFKNEIFVFQVSQYEDIYFFYGFFIKRTIQNRITVLNILTEYIYAKRNILQHG